MIEPKDLLKYAVIPTLQALGPRLSTLAGQKLVMGTIAQESLKGRYLDQRGGPAMGVSQI